MADGEITAVKFAEIMKTLRGHKLSPFVRNYLLTVRAVIDFSEVIKLNIAVLEKNAYDLIV